MTLAEWLDRNLELMKSTPSSATKKAQSAHLKRLMGVNSIVGNHQSQNHGIQEPPVIGSTDPPW
jgi:hypothetical protein